MWKHIFSFFFFIDVYNNIGYRCTIQLFTIFKGCAPSVGSFPMQTIQHHSNPSLCLNHWCWRSWSWTVLWRPIRLSTITTTKKDVLFIIGEWNAKAGSQEIPGVTGNFGLGIQWSRAKTNRILSREHSGHSKHPLPTI